MKARCDHDGGRGIGAGHVCRCVRAPGHPLDSDRPHGCTCGALWADEVQAVRQPATTDEVPMGPGDRGFTALVELANIRRLCVRHDVREADGNGVLRSTVAMVEELAIRRPPV